MQLDIEIIYKDKSFLISTNKSTITMGNMLTNNHLFYLILYDINQNKIDLNLPLSEVFDLNKPIKLFAQNKLEMYCYN